MLQTENQWTDEVCLDGQDAGKQKVQELQGIANQVEAGVRVLPSVCTAEHLVSPNSISGKQINNGKSSIKAAAQTTAGVEELLLLDPP